MLGRGVKNLFLVSNHLLNPHSDHLQFTRQLVILMLVRGFLNGILVRVGVVEQDLRRPGLVVSCFVVGGRVFEVGRLVIFNFTNVRPHQLGEEEVGKVGNVAHRAEVFPEDNCLVPGSRLTITLVLMQEE